jgi:flagellar assembly protein FliH
MASDPTPKEQLTAYQRWELNAFDDSRDKVKLPTADQIQRIQQQAYQEGFAAGMKDGRAESQALAHRLQVLMLALNRSMSQFEEAMAQEIMDLALDIARQMVRSALQAEPALVLAVVREAIESLPQINQNPTLVLHPQDAQLVRDMLSQDYQGDAWRIVEDPQMERGGCRVETASSEIDANIEDRWKRIVNALGSDAPWRK